MTDAQSTVDESGGGCGKGGKKRSGEPTRLALESTGGVEMGASTKKPPFVVTMYGSMLGCAEESRRSPDVRRESDRACDHCHFSTSDGFVLSEAYPKPVPPPEWLEARTCGLVRSASQREESRSLLSPTTDQGNIAAYLAISANAL